MNSQEQPKTTTDLDGFRFLSESLANETLRANAQNILDSYAHPWDILAEGLQNSVDAIEQRAEQDKHTKKTIEIVFNANERGIEIADTGIGMTCQQLKEILAPGKSLKRGVVNLRGEKGVGISFMVFSCNIFKITTCDGKNTTSLEINGAHNWIKGAIKDEPTFSKATLLGGTKYLESSTYTKITSIP